MTYHLANCTVITGRVVEVTKLSLEPSQKCDKEKVFCRNEALTFHLLLDLLPGVHEGMPFSRIHKDLGISSCRVDLVYKA